jgi:gamma-glutamyltranspeptidase/glutathione hydrolase
MTTQDLASYRVIPRDPVHLNYRGNDIYGMAPPSSGGTTDLEALNILQHAGAPTDKTQALYHYLEASRLAYADRNAYLGDPAFVNNPIEGMLSDDYAAQQAARIPPTAPQGPVDPGHPPGTTTAGSGATVDRVGSTTHLSVADRWGNIVAYTFTIEQTGGDGIVVPGYGFLLNNELTDFNTESLTAPNRAQGGKRPRSSMSPTILERHGRPVLTVGSPGGASIITTVLQILVNRLELGYTLPQAIAAPRASQRNQASGTGDAEQAFLDSAVGQELIARFGQKLAVSSTTPEIGAATGIEFLGRGLLLAAAEPVRRGGGSAVVVHDLLHH